MSWDLLKLPREPGVQASLRTALGEAQSRESLWKEILSWRRSLAGDGIYYSLFCSGWKGQSEALLDETQDAPEVSG